MNSKKAKQLRRLSRMIAISLPPEKRYVGASKEEYKKLKTVYNETKGKK